jgi:serine O-acetyltransferase
LRRYTRDSASLRRFLHILLTDPGFHAVLFYRIASCLFRLGVPLLPALVTRFAVSSTGAQILPGAVFGPGLQVCHPVGIVAGDGVRAGPGCTLLQNVTLGEKQANGNDPRYPTLGSHVTVCAGAVVLGHIRIGDGATVGANSVVLHDVPAWTVVAGAPARPVDATSLRKDLVNI